MKHIQLHQLPVAAIHALAHADLANASAAAGVTLPYSFVDSPDGIVWVMRSKQLIADPGCASWITRAIIDSGTGTVVGRAGFHGPPDENGLLEIGYAIDPAYRRQGYARAAFETLLARARREPAAATLRATIRPDNTASYNLIAGYGFTEVGEQWDEIDGLEIIHEVDVRT